ncbi:MAG TPA: T9SS type A sorting domain-containing protein [Chitinophagaceae bacterium]|nr:T9SS type A sorting domain-containing protein [Chitinophagaceae bacterium]
MKTTLLFSSLFLYIIANAQITSPVIRANFGVDADLKARTLSGSSQASDDWFLHPAATGTSSDGTFVIDTTGASAILAGYASNVNNRMKSFYRAMSRPPFSVVDNRLWLDAMFVRDYHGNDTTAFTAGSDKNGMSPANWSGGTQGVPDKNDILDMFMHVRRAGSASSDSLWFFGGLSLNNVTGNRYFDFELYQTDINYDRASSKWYGYGPDEGHTSWEFDASGNIIKPGDIIFSAEYQSSSLSKIEARIWINRAALSITPTAFSWSGQFDGGSSGAQYGYASILPKNGGTFYTGLQSGNGEWTGPYSLVLQDNSLATEYTSKQFMEFSVNLSKLGLDPVLLFGTDVCGTPFNRMVIKTRASASFTSELKDFIAPTDLFLAPRALAAASVPLFCGNPNNVSTLQVLNPSASSVYTWSTPDGHILNGPVAASVTADAAGTYIVTQQLMAGCGAYAKDTVHIVYEADCTTMNGKKVELKVTSKSDGNQLNWTAKDSSPFANYDIERSSDGVHFLHLASLTPEQAKQSRNSYTDNTPDLPGPVYYRIKYYTANGFGYSALAKVLISTSRHTRVITNPANNYVRFSLGSEKGGKTTVVAYNLAGVLLYNKEYTLKQGTNLITINEVGNWHPGVYLFHINQDGKMETHKIIVHH